LPKTCSSKKVVPFSRSRDRMASNKEAIGWTQKNGSQMIPLVRRLGYKFGIVWHNIGLCILCTWCCGFAGFLQRFGISARSSSGAQLAWTATMENSKLRPNWAKLGRNGSSYFTVHVGLWQEFRWTLRIVTSCHALRQDSRDVVQTSGDCGRKTRTLPAWLKPTVNSENTQINLAL